MSREKNGWLEARFRKAWSIRPGEIPESRLVPLEKKHVLALDDYASLAGSLTEPQRVALDRWRPLASFSTFALRRGFWGLYVCDAVPPEMRSQPVRLENLPPLARDRWDRAVTELAFSGVGSEQWMDAVLSGRRPKGAGFAVLEDSGGFYPSDFDRSVQGEETRPATFLCWTFRFGNETGAMTANAPTMRKEP